MPSNCQTWGVVFAIVLSTFVSPIAIADEVAFLGPWNLDKTRSTDVAEELKGILSKKKKSSYSKPSTKSRKNVVESAQSRYWEIANNGQQWAHSPQLAHAGPLQRVLESENLEIVRSENGYTIIYADGYERFVKPNPGGRVFTASGDELVEDEIGFTLAYWRKSTLVLETRLSKGGKAREEISLDGDNLSVSIEIDRRDWKWIAKVTRLFTRASMP